MSTVLPGGLASNLFLVTFGTAGSQTLTATDTTDSLTVNASVNVVQGLGGLLGPSAPIAGPGGPGGQNDGGQNGPNPNAPTGASTNSATAANDPGEASTLAVKRLTS